MFEKYETPDKLLTQEQFDALTSGTPEVSTSTSSSADNATPPPPVNSESICDYVTVDIFTPEECEDIISYVNKKYKLTPGTLDKDTTVNPEIRSSKVAWIRKKDKKMLWVHDRIKDAIMSINEEKYNFDVTSSEKIQFTKYEAGHHYTWHTDMGEYDPSNRRKLSVTVNLTDNTCYDGGNLLLLIMGSQYYTVPPKIGQAVIFPSYIPHIVTEVTPKPGGG